MNDLKSLPNPVLNHATLIAMLGNYARPNDKIRKLIAKQELLPLKRGLYLTANLHQSYYEFYQALREIMQEIALAGLYIFTCSNTA